jgi:hypothetical protein
MEMHMDEAIHLAPRKRSDRVVEEVKRWIV